MKTHFPSAPAAGGLRTDTTRWKTTEGFSGSKPACCREVGVLSRTCLSLCRSHARPPSASCRPSSLVTRANLRETLG